MRRNMMPPRPRAHQVGGPTRKVFNCIVDDTALVAGVKSSTRDGIRKWVMQGAIRLFVPLHTLGQLDRLRHSTERISSDAHEALIWLDAATEDPKTKDQVILELADEIYGDWSEVERFLLPETLLSMQDSESEGDDSEFGEDLENSLLQLDVSDGTSVSSSHSLEDPPKTPQSPKSPLAIGKGIPQKGNARGSLPASVVMGSPDRTARKSSETNRPEKHKSPKHGVPKSLQGLFNHILWRIHQESNPDAALESFILLTNDPVKQMIAQKFGIRAKRLEQLRDAIAREDREYRNHKILNKIESRDSKPPASTEDNAAEQITEHQSKSSQASSKVDSDDEDVVLFKRAPRGPQAEAANGQRVWDPNDFGRINHRGGRGGPRGRGGFVGPPRGRGGPPRGRGGFMPRGPSASASMSFRPSPVARPNPDPNALLNPDSYERPAPRVSSGRGGRRTLWEPN